MHRPSSVAVPPPDMAAVDAHTDNGGPNHLPRVCGYSGGVQFSSRSPVVR